MPLFLPLLLVFAAPFVIHAATITNILNGFTSTFGNFFVPMLMGVALVVFIWGLVLFIAHSGDESEVQKGKQRMIWGIVALTLIVAVWGIVNLIILIIGANAAPDCSTIEIDTVQWRLNGCV